MGNLLGIMRLQFSKNGKIVEEVVKKNNITGYDDGVLNEGNFDLMIDPDKLLPIVDKFFGGVVLTDKANDASTKMIAGDANITAQASNDAYTGTNLKRGSFNSNESGKLANGWRKVFDFGTSIGNGTIASVCLCRPQFGTVVLGTDSVPTEGQINEILHETNYNSEASEALQDLSIVDYDKEIGYKIEYSSGIITVTEYPVNTKSFRLSGGVFDVAGDGVAHEIEQTVANFTNTGTASVSYTGDKIHLITFVPGSGTVNDYSINTTSWTCTATSHSYSGVQLMPISIYSPSANPILRKDIMPIIDGYLYGISSDGTKVYKMNLTNDADVEAFDIPGTALTQQMNGGCLILPNGDWYKFPVNSVGSDGMTSCLYCHGGEFYRARYRAQFVNATYMNANSFNGNDFGTVLAIGTASNHGFPLVRLDTLFPYVSTVANLDSPVVKTPDLNAKVIYDLIYEE